MADNKKGILVLIVLCGLGLFMSTRNSPSENSVSKENPSPIVNPNPIEPVEPQPKPQPPRKPRPGP